MSRTRSVMWSSIRLNSSAIAAGMLAGAPRSAQRVDEPAALAADQRDLGGNVRAGVRPDPRRGRVGRLVQLVDLDLLAPDLLRLLVREVVQAGLTGAAVLSLLEVLALEFAAASGVAL